MNLTDLQKPLLALIQKASKAVLAIYTGNSQDSIHFKTDHSPVTKADLLAHDILSTGLQALIPGYPILSEEGIHIPWEERAQWTRYWLIDPVDGTRQFVKHNGEFTINVALIENHVPIIGLIHVPVTQETFYACNAWGGAYKCDAHQVISPLRVRTWKKDNTILLTSRAANPIRIQALFSHLGKFTQISMSSALKFAYIAEGKADVSPRLGDTSEWDTAAGQCILELAGGALVDLQGAPLRYNMQASVINPHFIALGDRGNLKKLIQL